MKKVLFLLNILLSTSYCFSQNDSDEPQNVIVNWKVGTSKTISQIDSTIIYSNDSIFLATGASSNYTIKIVSHKDTVYEVIFKKFKVDDNISVESEIIDATPIEQLMQELLLELQKKMTDLEYSFLVDQNTAMAFEVKNQEELMENIEEMVVIVLNQLLDKSKIELEETQKNEIHLKVKQYMQEQMPAALQTMLNAFNYIFQAYSFPFVLDKTHTQEVEVYDVDQIQYGDQEHKAKLIVTSSSSNSELTLDYEYVYDKEQAYQSYIVAQGKADQIPLDKFDIDERVNSKFDLQTSWIKSSSSFVNAKMGEIVVNNSSRVLIK